MACQEDPQINGSEIKEPSPKIRKLDQNREDPQINGSEIKEPSRKIRKLDQNGVHGDPKPSITTTPLFKVKKLSEKAVLPSRASSHSAGYDLSSATESKVPARGTYARIVPLSMDTIFEEVMKSEEGRSMTLERARASLIQLGCHLPEIGIDETFSIDLKSIIELAQNEEVESIVLKRYGREAYRIFRLLSKAGHLVETDKISNTTFVAKKDTAKILYTLWKDDYLHMEKIVTYGSKQSQFLLWKVNKHTLWDNVLNEMYHTALNLRIRIAHEQEQEKEILRIPREKLVGELAKRYARLRKVRIVLESSLMKLDDAIMLFHDF